MKKKYNSADPVLYKASCVAGQLGSQRKGAIVRQIPYHRKAGGRWR